MRYKDDLQEGYVNGYYVGIRHGTNTQDALEPSADGYETQRSTSRFGSVTQDVEEPNYPEEQDYKITYVKGAEDATGTAPTETNKFEGDEVTVKANTFTYADHTFTGWLSSDGKVYQAGDKFKVAQSDVTLTAQWEADE